MCVHKLADQSQPESRLRTCVRSRRYSPFKIDLHYASELQAALPRILPGMKKGALILLKACAHLPIAKGPSPSVPTPREEEASPAVWDIRTS